MKAILWILLVGVLVSSYSDQQRKTYGSVYDKSTSNKASKSRVSKPIKKNEKLPAYQKPQSNSIPILELDVFSQGFYIVNTRLNIRKAPSLDAPILGKFSKGQQIYVSRIIGKWALVNVRLSNNRIYPAYVSSEYIKRNIGNTDNGYYSNQRGVRSGLYHSSSKTYDYSVSGYGDNGYVYGDINVDRDGGNGYVYDEDGNEIYIDVDWTGKGELDGYDGDGNYYELEVD